MVAAETRAKKMYSARRKRLLPANAHENEHIHFTNESYNLLKKKLGECKETVREFYSKIFIMN
jgi:hypothetical protein